MTHLSNIHELITKVFEWKLHSTEVNFLSTAEQGIVLLKFWSAENTITLPEIKSLLKINREDETISKSTIELERFCMENIMVHTLHEDF